MGVEQTPQTHKTVEQDETEEEKAKEENEECLAKQENDTQGNTVSDETGCERRKKRRSIDYFCLMDAIKIIKMAKEK